MCVIEFKCTMKVIIIIFCFFVFLIFNFHHLCWGYYFIILKQIVDTCIQCSIVFNNIYYNYNTYVEYLRSDQDVIFRVYLIWIF